MGDRPLPPAPPSYLLEGRYLAETHVARGETADVFSGTDTWSGEHVAVRRLRADRTDRAAAFRRMSERLFGATSARLLRAIAMGEDREGLPFLVTELLVGRDVERLGQVRWEVACEVTRQCAVAVAEMHILGLHHGDLRPSTFFVGASTAGGSRVKLLDLGTGERSATAVKDVRALVGILHRLLIGRPPLPAKARTALRLNVAGVPPTLEQSLGRWLDADGEGFTADEMATDLLEIRNASHGEFWSGAQAPSQAPPARGPKVSVQPRSSMIILEGPEDDEDDELPR
jgi:tRNA A-37 threonylcarbamoyl transferase component Bud32